MAQKTSLQGAKLKAVVSTLREDTSLWPAILVALGALFLLQTFAFYPPLVVLLLALACGGVAYVRPPMGTVLSLLLALPAVAYQSPLFAWLFLMVIALALFEAWSSWAIFSFLQIVICAPFAAFPLSLLGGFVQFGLTLGALYIGSKRSILISVPAVFAILLLSTLWVQPNSAFMLIKDVDSYGPALESLSRESRAGADWAALPLSAAGALADLFRPDVVASVNPALFKVGGNAIRLLVEDAAVLQLAAWAAVLFIVGFIPGRYDGAHKQVVAGLAIALIPLSHYAIAQLYAIPFPLEMVAYTLLSIVALLALENLHIDLSRERSITRREKTKKFGKMGVEDLGESDGPASLDAVGGYEDVKQELREAIVAPLQKKELAVAYGLKPAAGLLLFGPPGTGKTLLMRALSKELDMGFYYVKCSEILSEWYGESEKNVSELFAAARKNAPCILFFDEIDAIAKRRDAYSADDVGPRVMSVLLAEMDGFKQHGGKPVIVIGATNLPDQLDPAIMRPGRMDKIIYMHLPDKEARLAILKVHLGKLPRDVLGDDVDPKRLADLTERYSGADLANLVSEAIRQAAREAVSQNAQVPVSQKHLLSVLKSLKPSTALERLAAYEQFRLDYERRSGAAVAEKPADAVSFEDVVGLDDVRDSLREALELPLLHDDLIKEYKVKPAKGLLLFGPPGCGKTLIVRAAANNLNATFLTLSGAELVQRGPDLAAQMLRQTFNRAREQAPCLLFLDEIESLTPSRSHFSSQVLTQLLQEMDGTAPLKNVMVVGATNKPSQIDSALLRPGRFDKILYIPPPDAEGRADILRKNLSALAPHLDWSHLASECEGFSGADLASAAQEAKMGLVRGRISGKQPKLTTEGVLKILLSRRPSITDEDLDEYERFRRSFGERR